jgi:predicted DsbA family dithiol-disulfide isomerase
VPNYVAEAARELAVTDDRVRLALAHAALREGQKVGSWDVAIAVAAKAGALDKAALLARAESPEVATRIEETTAEFNALKVNQRPTFLIENRIGDRAVLSGVARIEPLAAIIDALATDEAAYVSWQAHCGDPPES